MNLTKTEVSGSYSVRSFLTDVLKKRFQDDPAKQIALESGGKMNFACPFCGDSAKDSHKKRGNLWIEGGTYKCFNDGCGKWTTLTKFVAFFSRKFSLPIPSISVKAQEFVPKASSKKKGSIIEVLVNRRVSQSLLDMSTLRDRFFLTPCSEAAPDSPVRKFLDKRMILGMPVFEKSCYFDSRQDKVYLFNIDARSEKILGFAVRMLDDSRPGPKYSIKTYSELKKNGIVKGMDDDTIRDIDLLNNYFNVLNVSFSKPITVVEGQIDSMFVKNCVAATGVMKTKALLTSLISKKKDRILFDNDKAGKSETIKLLVDGYSVFLWSKVIDELKKKYYGSIKEIRAIKDVNDLYRFFVSVEPKMNFKKFNDYLDGYFSTSQYDIALV